MGHYPAPEQIKSKNETETASADVGAFLLEKGWKKVDRGCILKHTIQEGGRLDEIRFYGFIEQ